MYGNDTLFGKNSIQAIQVLKEAVDYAQKNNLTPQYICSSYQMLYKSYSALKDDRMMLKYIRLYKEAAEKYGIMHSCLSVYMDYADYYDSVKDYKLANHYMKLYLDTKDSILNFQEFETIKNNSLFMRWQNMMNIFQIYMNVRKSAWRQFQHKGILSLS